MNRKALITSLTLAAAAGAISCTAATAAETPTTQSGFITIRDNGQPNRDQTRSLTVALITKNGAGNAATQPATAPEPVTEAPVEVEAPAEEPAQEAPAEAPAETAPQEGSTPEVKTPAEPEAPAQEATHPESPAPGEVEVVIAPSPEPTHEVPETPGNTDVPINPEPEPVTPEPETPGNTDVPINPEPEPVRSERDENPADHQPVEDTAPVIEPEPEPSTPAPEVTETPGEVEVVIAPSPEPSQKVPADTANNEAPDNSEVFSTEVPIAPEDAQAHSRATSSDHESTSDTADHAVTGNDEVGIAPQAPGAKTPKGKKGSTTQPAADAKSPASVPSAQSTAPARDELAYTGASAETGGIAIGGFMLILTGAAGVWSVRRKTSNA